MSSISETLAQRLRDRNLPFHANSNIAAVMEPGDKDLLIEEVAEKFSAVLRALVIDTENDPHSKGTARRIAKMYLNEIMAGRYDPEPTTTFFPNRHTGRDAGFTGMLVVRTEIKSLCSHHHQPVYGLAFIGILPSSTVIGLSKYSRIVQHLARRGTQQEELAEDIADAISARACSEDVAVYLQAEHGCVTNRGIEAHDSTTQTTVLRGLFMSDGILRKEFYDNVQFQLQRHPK